MLGAITCDDCRKSKPRCPDRCAAGRRGRHEYSAEAGHDGGHRRRGRSFRADRIEGAQRPGGRRGRDAGPGGVGARRARLRPQPAAQDPACPHHRPGVHRAQSLGHRDHPRRERGRARGQVPNRRHRGQQRRGRRSLAQEPDGQPHRRRHPGPHRTVAGAPAPAGRAAGARGHRGPGRAAGPRGPVHRRGQLGRRPGRDRAPAGARAPPDRHHHRQPRRPMQPGPAGWLPRGAGARR